MKLARLTALLAAAIGLQSGAVAAEMPRVRQDARALLQSVTHWGCQYLDINLDRVAASGLDLVVLEPVIDGGTRRRISAADVRRLQRKPDGGRRLVLAYLSVGEATEHRDYWQPAWRTNPPDWLGAPNPNWPGARAVAFWRPEWRRVLLEGPSSELGRILAAGFDGAFLDRVDAYADWTQGRASAAVDMIGLVEQIGATARAQSAGFLLIGQNAEPLLSDARYRSIIDAVSKESLLYGARGEGVANTDDDLAWSLSGLDAAKRYGLPVLAIEYLSDPVRIADARRRLAALGFVPFIANRQLDRLPGSWPP